MQMAYVLYVILVMLAIVEVTAGVLMLSQATQGAGIVAAACFTAILARIAQAAQIILRPWLSQRQIDLLFLFVFFNDGPIPIVVQHLRLVLCEETEFRPLFFNAIVPSLAWTDGSVFATQFPVRGHEAVLQICEFQREPGGMRFEAHAYPIELQAKLDNDLNWKTICKFDLNVREMDLNTINSALVPHDNMTVD
jgi:hypothetical protein